MNSANTQATPKLLKVQGGPNLCGTCSKAVRVTGAVILAVVVIGIFFIISAFRGMGSFETVGITALMTLPVAALGMVGLGYTIGLPFKHKSFQKIVVEEMSKQEAKNSLICDGCHRTYLAVP